MPPRLSRAPFAQNFPFTIGMLRQWAEQGCLEIAEGSIVRDQLKRISSEDLAQAGVEHTFYAIRALDYLVASIEKNGSWQAPDFVMRQGRRKCYWHAWM